jgi:hypothetical protein
MSGCFGMGYPSSFDVSLTEYLRMRVCQAVVEQRERRVAPGMVWSCIGRVNKLFLVLRLKSAIKAFGEMLQELIKKCKRKRRSCTFGYRISDIIQ